MTTDRDSQGGFGSSLPSGILRGSTQPSTGIPPGRQVRHDGRSWGPVYRDDGSIDRTTGDHPLLPRRTPRCQDSEFLSLDPSPPVLVTGSGPRVEVPWRRSVVRDHGGWETGGRPGYPRRYIWGSGMTGVGWTDCGEWTRAGGQTWEGCRRGVVPVFPKPLVKRRGGPRDLCGRVVNPCTSQERRLRTRVDRDRSLEGRDLGVPPTQEDRDGKKQDCDPPRPHPDRRDDLRSRDSCLVVDNGRVARAGRRDVHK